MSLTQTLIEAFRSLLANRLRSFLTMLGIIIGIGSVVLMLAVGDSVSDFIRKEVASLGSNQFIVQPGVATENGVKRRSNELPSLTIEDAEAMRDLANLNAAAPVIQGFFQVVTGAGNMDLTVAGSSPELMVVRNWTVAQGVALSHDDIRASRRVAVIGKNVARTLFPDDATPLGQSMRIGGTPFTVIGVLAGEGRTLTGEDLGDIVTVPISAIPVRMPKPRTVHYISVQAKDERQMAAAERELSDLLRDRHRITADKPDDFRVLNLADIAKQGALIATSLSIGLGAIGAISLLVGGIGIMNIMLVSVSERVREIGLRMAIGAQPRHILIQFLSESVVMCVVGGLAGVGLAMLGASVVNSISESFKMTISMSHVLTACGFASAVGLFFGYYPAHRASRMLPIECLRQD